MKISQDTSSYTVIVTVAGTKERVEEILDHAKSGLSLFKAFDGFLAGATHLSNDGTKIIQYLQWRDRESHERCQNDSSWDESESSKNFMSLWQSGDIDVDVKVFSVVACEG